MLIETYRFKNDRHSNKRVDISLKCFKLLFMFCFLANGELPRKMCR